MAFALAVAYCVIVSIRIGLTLLNVWHLRRHETVVPPELAGSVDLTTLQKSSRYTQDRARFGVVTALGSAAAVLVFLFGGGLALYDAWVRELATGFVLHGVVFFVGLTLLGAVLELPLSAYSTFRIEARHGFNRTTPGLFLSDWLKSTLLGAVIVALLSAGGLALVRAAPETWWFFAWIGFTAFGIFMMYIAPYVIEPLFFKMTPLGAEELRADVERLAARCGVRVAQVLEMDASRRSSHSNAYFTGLGRVKRVVLFDTLLERMTREEVLAVLAHELGHWKLKHVTKSLLLSAALSLAGLYLAHALLGFEALPGLVGLDEASFPARTLIVGFVFSLVGFPLTPLFALRSRAHEWQADRFASELTSRPQDLGTALVKLARDNLSNLHPHPLYAAFYYSHPPMIERVRRLLPHGVPREA